MKFGPVPVAEAAGSILAHSVVTKATRFRKGRVLSADDVAMLITAGIDAVTVARPGPDDTGEDAAADRLIAPMTGPGMSASAAFTGRANLYAAMPGLVTVDRGAVDALNAIDEGITLATLPDATRVTARQMLATIKIIPYAVPTRAVEAAAEKLATPPVTLHPFLPLTARLILTETPGMKPSLLAKAERAVAERLAALDLTLRETVTVPHEAGAVADALSGGKARGAADLILLFGATATSDRRDVCPDGLIRAGGTTLRFGMPVDPGNLLFTGQLGQTPVIGMPGCARSPALNGADWVLERAAAGLPLDSQTIAGMGVGGLLKEIPTRPQPRSGNSAAPARPFVEVLLLAGGASRRMQGRDKLLETVEGKPLLRRAAEAATASRADRVSVVIPDGNAAREDALNGLDVALVRAKGTAGGMAVSLRAGLAARADEADAVIVMLADMPEVSAAHLDRLISAFDPAEGRSIAQAMTEDGQPGHPVLFGRRFFEALMALEGDVGARAILAEARDYLVQVPTPGRAAVLDLDTPEAWAAWRAEGADA